MAGDADGLIWWIRGDTSSSLAVREATVVTCWPPDHAPYVGRDARDVWRELLASGATLRWVPAGEVAEDRVSLISVYYRRSVAAWDCRPHLAGGVRVSVGWMRDGRWWVNDTGERSGWILTGLDAERRARELAAERLTVPRRIDGTWASTIAEYQPGTNRAAKVPPRPPGHGDLPGDGSSLTQATT
jgi:hypothetical protein